MKVKVSFTSKKVWKWIKCVILGFGEKKKEKPVGVADINDLYEFICQGEIKET